MPALALVAWGFAKSGFGAALKWLSHRSLAELALIALAIFAVVQRFEIKDVRSDAARWHKQFDKEHAARAGDRKAYEQAQRQAAELNHKQVEQIKSKQEAITNEVKSDLQSRLELIRRELRTAAPSSPPKGSGAGGPGNTPCRAYDPAWLCVSPKERLHGAENEERHDQLITWEERQSKVRP